MKKLSKIILGALGLLCGGITFAQTLNQVKESQLTSTTPFPSYTDRFVTPTSTNQVWGFNASGQVVTYQLSTGFTVTGSYPNYTLTAAGGGGTTTNALTMNNSGSGAASGSTFNGASAVTISYNSIGAAGLAATNTFSAVNTFTATPLVSEAIALNTIADGLQLYNTTNPASRTSNAYSPFLHFEGKAYANSGSPNIQTVDLQMGLQTLGSNSTYVTGSWVLSYSTNGGAATTPLSVNLSTGSMTFAGTSPSINGLLNLTTGSSTGSSSAANGTLGMLWWDGGNLTMDTLLLAASGLTSGSQTLTLAMDGTGSSYTLTMQGNAALNQSVTTSSTPTFSKVNGLTLTANSTGFSVAGGTTPKTLQVNNTLTLAGTDSTTMTFPAASTTVAGLGTTQTFTGVETFTPAARTSGVLPYFSLTLPADTGLTASTEAPGFTTGTATRTWATTGTVALQREFKFAAPTYASASASQTFTVAATVDITGAPIAGTNAIITAGYALNVEAGNVWLQGTTSATSSTVGALIIGNGGASLQVAIGAGKIATGSDILVNGITVGLGKNALGQNTAVGNSAVSSTTTGQQNVGVGISADGAITTGSGNTAVGAFALQSSVAVSYNTAIGANSLTTASTYGSSTAVGYNALANYTTGGSDTAVGYGAGANSTDTGNCTFIGYNAGTSAGSYTNSTAIGNGASITASNQMVYGNTSVTSNVFNGGITVPGTSTLAAVSATTGTFSSTVSGTGITSLFASPPAIGSTSASTGAFTTLSASSTVSGAGINSLFASPPAIGSTTASTGAFTTLAVSSTLTVSGSGAVNLGSGTTTVGGNLAVSGTSTLTGNVTAKGTQNLFNGLGTTATTPTTAVGMFVAASTHGYSAAFSDNVSDSLYISHPTGGVLISTDPSGALQFATNGTTLALTLDALQNAIFAGGIKLTKTIASGTGAQTQNTTTGQVQFAGAATSLVVTNSLCSSTSIITANLATNDTTAVLGAVVAGSGSFTIYMKTAPTGTTLVEYRLTN